MRSGVFLKLVDGFNELERGKFTRDKYVKTKGVGLQYCSNFIVLLKEIKAVKDQEPLIKVKNITEKQIIELLSIYFAG